MIARFGGDVLIANARKAFAPLSPCRSSASRCPVRHPSSRNCHDEQMRQVWLAGVLRGPAGERRVTIFSFGAFRLSRVRPLDPLGNGPIPSRRHGHLKSRFTRLSSRSGCWGHAMNKSIAIAIICSLTALVGVDQTALAQAGSTGGIVGKTDKSVSGGETTTAQPGAEPHRSQHRTLSGASSDSGASHIAGRWSWTAICVFSYSGVFEIRQAGGGTFSGEFFSDVAGRISEGKLLGSGFSFVRDIPSMNHRQRWTGTLSGPQQMKGTVSEGDQNICTFSATKS
jgi:hypothetical protein